VTFLFTDIEGSTRLERALGGTSWATVVADHDRRLREAIEAARGQVVKTEGDAVFAAFAKPADAVTAIVAAQRALVAEPFAEGAVVRIRAGLHLGVGRLRGDTEPGAPADYVGIDVNYAARIAAAGNGGQIVLSDPLVQALGPEIAPSAAGGTLIDEGLRNVKDFEEPSRLYRLVVPGAADDDRPLRTLDAPSNLPHGSTSLVGRETEIEKLAAELQDGRIVTLTGPGGSGKTRLAIGVAEVVRGGFPHGTWFVDLADVRDAALFEPTIALTVGIRESSERTLAEALRGFLRDRQVLLLLDNLEQLLPPAAETTARLIRSAPGLRILATSRELLRIGGEHGHVVPPLDVSAGVTLFEDRARLHRPDLVIDETTRATIQEICEKLDGLPLAIELAAARIRVLSPAAILDRLGHSLDLAGGARDLPERQRTLRGAIDWSHELLSEPERRLFRRLSVFAGGWTAEAALEVTDSAGDIGIDVLDGLESLLDKSLIRADPTGAGDTGGEARFSLHVLLREYARERLVESGELDELEARHARAMRGLAERDGGQILTKVGEQVMQRLDREQHNLRAAIDWSLRTGELTVGLAIMSSSWRWYQQRGRLRDGRTLLGELLEREGSSDDVRLRIATLAADGGLAYWMEDFEGCRARYEERLSLADQTGDKRLIAEANYDLGFLGAVANDLDFIVRHEQRALELFTELGDKAGVERAHQTLVLRKFLAGDIDEALADTERNLAAFRELGSLFQVADSLTLVSAIGWKANDPAVSWAYLIEALAIFSELDLASGLARSFGMATLLQLRYGDPELGARIAGATEELHQRKNVMIAPTKVLHLPDGRDLAVEILGAERARELMAVGAATPVARIIEEILAAPVPGASSAST
jgi:predicted ATPase/class 3 adenylate cyclase